MDDSAKEVRIPLVLVGIGVGIYLIGGFLYAGTEGAAVTLAALGIGAVLQIILGVIALYITAAVMQIDFGPLGTGVLKLAAIFIFPDAIAALIPVQALDWLVAFILYLSLLAWLFSLEPMELIVCAIVIFLVRLIVAFVILGVLVSNM